MFLQIEDDPYTIDIKVTEPHKVGDGMGAYIVYKIITQVMYLSSSHAPGHFQQGGGGWGAYSVTAVHTSVLSVGNKNGFCLIFLKSIGFIVYIQVYNHKI